MKIRTKLMKEHASPIEVVFGLRCQATVKESGVVWKPSDVRIIGVIDAVAKISRPADVDDA